MPWFWPEPVVEVVTLASSVVAPVTVKLLKAWVPPTVCSKTSPFRPLPLALTPTSEKIRDFLYGGPSIVPRQSRSPAFVPAARERGRTPGLQRAVVGLVSGRRDAAFGLGRPGDRKARQRRYRANYIGKIDRPVPGVDGQRLGAIDTGEPDERTANIDVASSVIDKRGGLLQHNLARVALPPSGCRNRGAVDVEIDDGRSAVHARKEPVRTDRSGDRDACSRTRRQPCLQIKETADAAGGDRRIDADGCPGEQMRKLGQRRRWGRWWN